MDKQLAKLFIVLALCVPSLAQLPLLPGVFDPPVGTIGGTLTFAQSCSGSASSVYQITTSCSTGNLGSGNLYTIATDSGQNYQHIIAPVIVAGTSTYTLGGNMTNAPGCSTGVNSPNHEPYCYYVLPSNSTGSSSAPIVYFAAPTAGSMTSGTCTVGETMTEATSGAIGIVWIIVPAAGPMTIYKVTGSPIATAVWTGGTSGCTFTSSAVPELAGVATPAHAFIAEFTVSANPSQVAISNDTALWLATASTTATGPTMTTSGTSPVIFGVITGDTGEIAISAINSPYSTANHNYHSGNQVGYAAAQTTTIPAWTITSAKSITRGMAFSYNPTAFTEGTFISFEGISSGSALSATNLQAATTGYAGANWSDSGPNTGKMTANTSANFPPLGNTVLLGDGTSQTAGSGSVGAVFTGDGASADRWYWNTQDAYASNTTAFGAVSMGFWWNTDESCSPGSALTLTIAALRGINDNDSNDANTLANGGSCTFYEAASGGTGGSITFIPGNWYWVDMYYSNVHNGTHSAKLYNETAITGASCTAGTTTLTTAGLPSDGNVTTGKTITLEYASPSTWNGTFASITVSGNNVSYSQTCPGASYSSGGYIIAQVGSTSSTATAGGYNWSSMLFGASSSGQFLANAKHEFFDSMMINLSGLDPLLP